MDYEVKLK